MPLDMPPPLPEPMMQVVDAEYEFREAAQFLGSDPDTVSFDTGDIDLHFGVEFAGNGYDPLTILSAFIAWVQVRGSFDAAVYTGPDISVGLGAEFFYGRPYLHQSIVEWRTDEEELLTWKNMETGFIPRVTVHLQEVNYVDFYAVVFCGPTWGQVNAGLASREASTVFRAGGVRAGAGIGANLVAKYGILLGGELRYQVGARLKSGDGLILTDAAGEDVATTSIQRHQKAPRGFSWVFNLGVRL